MRVGEAGARHVLAGLGRCIRAASLQRRSQFQRVRLLLLAPALVDPLHRERIHFLA